MTSPDHTVYEEPLPSELEELARALRADSPEPDPAFEADLRARMEAGFPRDPRSPRVRAPRLARRMLPAAAAFATGVVVGVAHNSGDLGNDSGEEGGGSAAVQAGDDEAAQEGAGGGGGGVAAESGSGAASTAQPLAPGRGDRFAPGRRDRRIERSISMTLAGPDDEIPDVADGVAEVTDRHGGFVLRSSLSTDEEEASGSFELRIPTTRLREALADLARLATVRSQSQSGQDVTRAHATARDRLDSARAERRGLLRRLETAATDEETESIRRRLDIVAGQINGLRARLRDLRLRTDYAVVTVELAGEDDASGETGGSFDDALGDAGDLLVAVAGALIRISAVALPLGLVALLGWLAGRGLRRRRRESVLA